MAQRLPGGVKCITLHPGKSNLALALALHPHSKEKIRLSANRPSPRQEVSRSFRVVVPSSEGAFDALN
jgi:thiamine monophosphate kinase